MCGFNYQIEFKFIMLVMNYFQDFIFGIDLQNSFLTFSFCFVRLADCFSSINSASTVNSDIMRFLVAFYFQELNQEMKTLPETDDNLLEDFVHCHYPWCSCELCIWRSTCCYQVHQTFSHTISAPQMAVWSYII